jgi:hypothetical protein
VTLQRTAVEGPLLIADISGYTSFFRDVEARHRDDAFANGATPAAYGLMSTLLGGIVKRIVPPFELAKLEGDAVFTFGTADDSVPRGDELVDLIRASHDEFVGARNEAVELTTCSCGACTRAGTLDLKFVLHAGRFVLQDIAGSRELTGSDVVLAHLLLKNRVSEVVGTGAYLLVSDAAARMLDIPIVAATPITESYEHYAPIDTFAIALDATATASRNPDANHH